MNDLLIIDMLPTYGLLFYLLISVFVFVGCRGLRRRTSDRGLSYNLAAIFGGAFAPTIAQALVNSKFGVAGVGWYMAIMAALALLALFLIKESKDKDYEL